MFDMNKIIGQGLRVVMVIACVGASIFVGFTLISFQPGMVMQVLEWNEGV